MASWGARDPTFCLRPLSYEQYKSRRRHSHWGRRKSSESEERRGDAQRNESLPSHRQAPSGLCSCSKCPPGAHLEGETRAKPRCWVQMPRDVPSRISLRTALSLSRDLVAAAQTMNHVLACLFFQDLLSVMAFSGMCTLCYSRNVCTSRRQKTMLKEGLNARTKGKPKISKPRN